MLEFGLTRLERVISGAGAVGTLPRELDRRGLARALVITTASLGRSALMRPVLDALGARCAGVAASAAQHAPAQRVRQLAELIERLEADCVVSFGGGSAIDSAKVAVASRINGRDMTREAGALDLARAFDAAPGAGFAHIAIPTTLSAGAFTPGGGVTDELTHRKRAVIDARLQPCVVIHDPQLCIATPDPLWISTGIRVLDHAIETIYARRAHPLSSALAVRAIRMIVDHLPASLGCDAVAVEHRGHCLDAAWLSLYGSFNTGLGLSHALGHQIGPAFDVPHGVTSCIALVPAMRCLAERAPGRFADIAEALRVPFEAARPLPGARACADAVAGFIRRFPVPTSLAELGIPLERALQIAAAVHEELTLFDALDQPLQVGEIEDLRRAAHGA
jgi:alcohol dehydrogenase